MSQETVSPYQQETEAYANHLKIASELVEQQQKQGSNNGIKVAGLDGKTGIVKIADGIYDPSTNFVEVDHDWHKSVNNIGSMAEVLTPKGTSLYFSSHENAIPLTKGLRSGSKSSVERRGKDGRTVYRHTFRNAKSHELITRLAMKNIAKKRHGK